MGRSVSKSYDCHGRIGRREAKAMLLHYVGEETLDIYETLGDAVAGDGEKQVDKAIDVLTSHFAIANQMRRAFPINYLQHHRGGHKIQDQTLTYCTWRTAQTQVRTSTFIQLMDRTLQNKQSFLLPFVVEIYCLLQILFVLHFQILIDSD